jgi:hypothetical protein
VAQKVKDSGPLSLREAIQSHRLEEFIRQEESRGVGPIDPDELDAEVERISKGSRPDGRTWRSVERRYSR